MVKLGMYAELLSKGVGRIDALWEKSEVVVKRI